MNYFPLFVSLANRHILLTGRGSALVEKLRALATVACRVTLFAMPEDIPADYRGEAVCRPIEARDLDGSVALVVCADSEQECLRLRALCTEERVLFCAVDRPALCDVFFPAVIARAPLCIAIGTEGTSPAAAVLLRQKIEALLPEHVEDILLWLSRTRAELSETLPRPARAAAMRTLAAAAFARGDTLDADEVRALLAAPSPADKCEHTVK